LSKLGLKKLITKCFNVSIAEEDLEKLFIEMDFNKNGKIDIDEFMNFLVNPDQKIKDTAILNSFFQIRKKHAKIN
jgi:Ca2+-binding EF-hand superfamily protein